MYLSCGEGVFEGEEFTELDFDVGDWGFELNILEKLKRGVVKFNEGRIHFNVGGVTDDVC